jgi:hypothetical protein
MHKRHEISYGLCCQSLGIEHWMMKDLPTDWIHQFENYTQTNHKRSTINDSNASKIDTEICLNGWFVNTMPDLNRIQC